MILRFILFKFLEKKNKRRKYGTLGNCLVRLVLKPPLVAGAMDSYPRVKESPFKVSNFHSLSISRIITLSIL